MAMLDLRERLLARESLVIHSRCPSVATRSFEDDEFPCRVVEALPAIVGAEDCILDAHAKPAFKIDARLVAEGHTRRERELVPFDEIGLLVYFQAKAVADTMQEVWPVTSLGDDRACGAVDLLKGNAWADGVERGLVGTEHGVVDRSIFLPWLADMGATRHV